MLALALTVACLLIAAMWAGKRSQPKLKSAAARGKSHITARIKSRRPVFQDVPGDV